MRSSVAEQTGFGVVHLGVPAGSTHLRLVRLMVADVAGQRDFELEAISELRMAADEACAQLVGVAEPDSILECAVRPDGATIELRATVAPRSGASIDQETFGWRVLSCLVDEAELITPEPGRVGIRLCKSDVLPD
jgi:serine/threonine-protein kinase RsbW